MGSIIQVYEEAFFKGSGEAPLYHEPLPQSNPNLDPGETVVLETEDAFSGQIRNEKDRRGLSTVPFSNPLTGPIRIEGAEKGDAVTVDIKRIRSTIGQGATYIAPSTRYLSSFPIRLGSAP